MGSTGPDSDDEVLSRWSVEDQRRILRKVDVRLIPICGLMYCVSLLDRTNLSNAAIAGMNVELMITKVNDVDRYSVITLMFFITYTIFQPPGTLLCRKIGPRVFLSAITFLWGCVMIGFGFVQDWTHLVGLRAILGVLEAGFFPGVVYLVSTWYKRYEMGKRYAGFYLIGCVASAFGGSWPLVSCKWRELQVMVDGAGFSSSKESSQSSSLVSVLSSSSPSQTKPDRDRFDSDRRRAKMYHHASQR